MTKNTFDRKKPDTMPPPPPPETSNLTLVLDLAAGVLTVATLEIDGAIDSTYRLILYLTAPVGFGITRPKKSLFKLICAMDAVVSPSTNEFSAPYKDRFGSPEEGAKVFLRAALIDRVSGLRFDIGQVSTIVTQT